mmetsp:Transcript_5383/g.11847  ORF Transcript_5383/g.11847 Transcript_5383/m.11847 type:complete len:118 (+) Transcript_5383:1292-1645(+)
MEPRHGRGTDETRAEDVHLFVEAVVDDEVVRHADAVGFHGVALAVVVVAHLGVVEVRDATAGGGGGGGGGCHCHLGSSRGLGWNKRWEESMTTKPRYQSCYSADNTGALGVLLSDIP